MAESETTPAETDTDTLEAAIAKVLLDEGGAPGSSLHSWRCEFPDVHGPCDCLGQTARVIIEAAAPLLTKAAEDAAYQRGRTDGAVDAWDEGYEACIDDVSLRSSPPGPNGHPDPTTNPYRTEARG